MHSNRLYNNYTFYIYTLNVLGTSILSVEGQQTECYSHKFNRSSTQILQEHTLEIGSFRKNEWLIMSNYAPLHNSKCLPRVTIAWRY